MKNLMFLSTAMLILTSPLRAEPSTQFSTVPGTDFAWLLTQTNGDWLLSFPANTSEIDNSDPADASLLGDFVNLPAMALDDLQDQGAFFTATLSPTGPLTIVSDTGEGTVLTADMAARGGLFIGTNFIAYSSVADDLDITDFTPGYSTVIDGLVVGEAGGLALDISFSGDATGGLDLVSALRAANGTSRMAGSSLSGQIAAVPAPGALLLAGAGSLMAAFLRRRIR